MTQRREPYFVLNRNEGKDTLHIDPIESCNVDDIEGRETIDAKTYEAMKAAGDARLCKHCHPEDPS